jgi:maternal-effect protein exuperantia
LKCRIFCNFRYFVKSHFPLLQHVETGQVLKTKSEISALQAFIAWLGEAAGGVEGSAAGGVLLVSHEQERQVLAPLLIQALQKYHLLESFTKIVRGEAIAGGGRGRSARFCLKVSFKVQAQA